MKRGITMSTHVRRPFQAYLEGMFFGIMIGSLLGAVISLLTLT